MSTKGHWQLADNLAGAAHLHHSYWATETALDTGHHTPFPNTLMPKGRRKKKRTLSTSEVVHDAIWGEHIAWKRR